MRACYCRDHCPEGYVFDPARRRWARHVPTLPEGMGRLLAVRREFERARILADRVLRREKLKRSYLAAVDEVFVARRAGLRDSLLDPSERRGGLRAAPA